MTKNIAKHKRSLCGRMKRASKLMLAFGGILIGTSILQSCDKDILEGQPEWLGNSIYERLQEGIDCNDGSHKSFNYTLRLIDDLDYKEVLSQTGSRTVFAAPDTNYESWFQNNEWGVTSYEQLSLAQKKELFNGTMIRNAYLVELMSNIPSTADNKDPETGMCMRRETARSIYDNIPVMMKKDFPHNGMITDDPVNAAWQTVKNNDRDKIYLLKDATTAPMIHFLPAFMKKNNILDTDLAIISDSASTSVEDSWVNGKKVISTEQTCKNGYVYVVDGVMSSNPNMAEIINNTPELSQWAQLMRRFSVPVRMSNAQQQEFWRLHPDCEKVDSLYQLRYLNYSGNHALATPTGNSDDNLTEAGLLKFDPGWNQYKADNGNVIMQNDCAAMLVPTNDALKEWFEHGGGKTLKEKFVDWDNIPYTTLVKLLNVNMLESFVATVPSKFPSILDDSQRSMGVEPSDIVKCYMGCNGVIYVTKKVFTPSEYSSVLFPALTQAQDKFATIYHALTSNYNSGYVATNGSAQDFQPYLSAMDSKFSLIIPFNVAESENDNIKYPVFRYIDPCSYGLTQQHVLEFYFDTKQQKVLCYAYKATRNAIGELEVDYTKGQAITDASIISNRLYDLIDNSIIIDQITPDRQYYKTKSGSIMYAVNNNDASAVFKGGYQLLNNESINVPGAYIYNMDKDGSTGADGKSHGNGTTYGVSSDPTLASNVFDIPMTSPKSVYEILRQEALNSVGITDPSQSYTLFYELLYTDPTGDDKKTLFGTKEGTNNYCANSADNKNLTVFDNYNYTVYLPSDKEIQEMIDNDYLPTWEDYYNSSDEAEKEKIAEKIRSFLRYHIQDNSVFVGGDKLTNQPYETAMLNKNNNRFYTLTLTQDGKNLYVKDQVHGTARKVVTTSGSYNIPCREYWIDKDVSATVTSRLSYRAKINSSSHAVVHKIDGVLLHDSSQLSNWHY